MGCVTLRREPEVDELRSTRKHHAAAA